MGSQWDWVWGSTRGARASRQRRSAPHRSQRRANDPAHVDARAYRASSMPNPTVIPCCATKVDWVAWVVQHTVATNAREIWPNTTPGTIRQMHAASPTDAAFAALPAAEVDLGAPSQPILGCAVQQDCPHWNSQLGAARAWPARDGVRGCARACVRTAESASGSSAAAAVGEQQWRPRRRAAAAACKGESEPPCTRRALFTIWYVHIATICICTGRSSPRGWGWASGVGRFRGPHAGAFLAV